MAFGLNLRRDLAKLSDQELADRFEQASAAHELAKENLRRDGGVLLFSVRGPIRHPRAYRFLTIAFVVTASADGWPALPLAIVSIFSGLVLSHRKYEQHLNPQDRPNLHLNMCEMKDIVDEIRRRVKYRKVSIA
jgi:hypothetical protein